MKVYDVDGMGDPRVRAALLDIQDAVIAPPALEMEIELTERIKRTELAGIARLAAEITEIINAHALQGFVYFLRCGDLLKVGYSAAPAKRTGSIRSSLPFDTEVLGYLPGSLAAETAIHDALARAYKRRKRDWFVHTPVLLGAIEAALTRTRSARRDR